MVILISECVKENTIMTKDFVDGGVEADFKLEEAQMVNRKYIADNIKNWTK